MPQYATNAEGIKVKVSHYDTSLMLTIRDIIPDDIPMTKRYLVRKEGVPEGRLRDFYNCRSNSDLMRKIFSTALSAILYEVASGHCKFIFPGASKASIFVGWQNDAIVRSKSKANKLGYLDLMQTDYRVPYVTFKFSPSTKKRDLKVYVDKTIFKEMIDHANTGEKFSNLPKTLAYFLPYIYSEFPYIEELKLQQLVTYCFNTLLWHLTHGEEVRFKTKKGEIRFFRALGFKHDTIMREVAQRRIIREHKERYDQFFI